MPWVVADTKLLACFEKRGIKWIRSLVTPDRHRMICEFEAPDAETLREFYRRNGMGFDRLWTAEVCEP